MKYPPNYIIYKQALRYLNNEDKGKLIDKIQYFQVNGKTFINCLLENFDINKFKDSPLIWQDIWLFNYVKFDSTKGSKRISLIAKYEKDIFIEDDNEFFSKKEFLNNLKLNSK